VRIDPETNQVARRIEVGNRPRGVAILGDDVVVGVRESDAGHRGGTLNVRMNRDLDSIDPAVAYDSTSWPILRMTGDGLVAFNQTSGLAGTQLVPDLAVSLPVSPDGGITWTFRLRPGIRFSTGDPVMASDFLSTFERDFEIGLPVPFYDDIVGARVCSPGSSACDLSGGILTNDAARTITFHLNVPDPDFLDKLALAFAYVVPHGTPSREATTPLPATGPYVIESYHVGKDLTLVRNQQFHEWSKAAQPGGYPDKIVYAIGDTADRALRDVIDGGADVFSTAQSETPPSRDLLTEVETQYASQVHTSPQLATISLFLNTNLPPFDDVNVRRAVNLAADRALAVEVAGGPDVAEVTCQILPPHFPGYRPYCPYTGEGTPTSSLWASADLRKARRLVDQSGTKGDKVTVWSWGDLGGFGEYTAKLLQQLGYQTEIRTRGGFGYFEVIGDSRTKAQIGTFEWISDYPAPSGFFVPVLTCDSFRPNDSSNVNVSQFCDPEIDALVDRALATEAISPDGARGLWEEVDRRTVDQAPWVPLVSPKVIDVVSERVGNYQSNPQSGMLLDQLWVR
jgi:peptide/nickel transport system substrate-binding protein